MLALLFRYPEARKTFVPAKEGKLFIFFMTLGIILNYFLSLYWGHKNHLGLLWTATLGSLLQFMAIAFLWKHLKEAWNSLINKTEKNIRILFYICLLCFAGKLLMQFITVVPQIAELAFTIRNYVIGYLHLTFLGVMTFFMIGWAMQNELLKQRSNAMMGVVSLVLGFILVEALLFVQGTMLWNGLGFISSYHLLIFLFTAFLPLGLMLIIVRTRTLS
jgi:hypothetical protein